jgi:hypothetical protein
MDRIPLYRKMHALLRELGIEKSKQALLEGYDVEHTCDLPDADLRHLVNRLSAMKENRFDKDLKRWRSNALTLLNKYGVYVTNNDWTQVNNFLLQNKIAGALLYELNEKQLMELCIKLRVILQKRKDRQDYENSIAKRN